MFSQVKLCEFALANRLALLLKTALAYLKSDFNCDVPSWVISSNKPYHQQCGFVASRSLSRHGFRLLGPPTQAPGIDDCWW